MTQTLRIAIQAAVSGLLALTLALTSASALAQTRTSITMEQAERIALDHVPNATVESIERDSEHGSTVYEVELRAADGTEHEIVIDANDGRVLRAEIDD